MDSQLLEIIDEALHRFGGRDLIASTEVIDLLLDLRTQAANRDLAALLASDPAPAGV